MIIKRTKISQELFNEDSKKINFLVETLKRMNIGELSEKQSMEYTSEELRLLERIGKILLWIEKNECPNFRTNKETETLIRYLVTSHQTKKPIQIFALFCPSYKKGKGEKGFNVKIGETTKKGLKNLDILVRRFSTLGFQTNGLAVYSDLALENFDKLNEKDMQDLEGNFNSFLEFGKQFKLEITKLSKIGFCFDSIGYSGITSDLCSLDNSKIDFLVLRSKPFYEEILNWEEGKIRTRTINLVNSCSKMGEEIRQLNPLSIMLITENMYERARFYYASEESETLPIIYPAKIETRIGELKE